MIMFPGNAALVIISKVFWLQVKGVEQELDMAEDTPLSGQME